MSGPALNQRNAHHAIHQAAFGEAERLTVLLRQAMRATDQQRALQVAAVLIEHWQTRTLRHADAEETGWYREVLAARPDLQADIIALTRDHELLRLLLAEIQGILSARGTATGIVERFEAMLLLNGIHSREEEQRLLGGNSIVEEPRREEVSQGVTQPGEPSEATPDGSVRADPQCNADAAPVPLAVARPALHAQLVELLLQRGLSPADLQIEVRSAQAGQAVLHVAYGREYAQTREWPLEPGAESVATEAIEDILHQVVEACERATRADYHARMRTPT